MNYWISVRWSGFTSAVSTSVLISLKVWIGYLRAIWLETGAYRAVSPTFWALNKVRNKVATLENTYYRRIKFLYVNCRHFALIQTFMSLKYAIRRHKSCAEQPYQSSWEGLAGHHGYNGACMPCASLYANSVLQLDAIQTHGSALNALPEEPVVNCEGVSSIAQVHNACSTWFWPHAMKVDRNRTDTFRVNKKLRRPIWWYWQICDGNTYNIVQDVKNIWLTRCRFAQRCMATGLALLSTYCFWSSLETP